MPKEYQLTDEDLAEIGRRMARGEDCVIPIRKDIQFTNGYIATNCLVWGHPSAYEIVKVPQCHGCLFYGRAKR